MPTAYPDARHETKSTAPVQEELLAEFQKLAKTAPSVQLIMERMATRLHETMTRYNWVGFYLVDPVDEGVLLIGPYAGSFTPNARIPLSSGLCGAAATSGQTVAVDDVSKDRRYLAGSPLVKSEIVVPILVKNKLAAELDIESYFSGTFTDAERRFVEGCAAVVGKYLGKA
jgi:L-methionine (R)-S-oxide reductase